MRLNRRPPIERQFVEADAGANHATGGGQGAFRASINGNFINVYEPISDYVSPWLSGGWSAGQRPRLPFRIGCPPKSLHYQFLQSTFYPLQTSRNHNKAPIRVNRLATTAIC